ncbi:MAG: hypothetical protein COB07_11895 [Sulfurovum sp.]|nr:MAG: hypothetical protein COB07_11895 [Sulfurovum sp.]
MDLITSWDEFIIDIDFNKINKIKKNIDDENSLEGMRVRTFLKNYMKKIIPDLKSFIKYNSRCNQAPSQQYYSEDNGLRCGLFYDKNYNDSIQLNITIGSTWGGGIFIKDNENLIFGNQELLKNLQKQYPKFIFSKKQQHIFAIKFKNNILSNGNETLKSICDLSNILEIMIRETKMQEKINLLKNRNQIILQGPPGTGKTRLAKQMAIRMTNNTDPIETNDEIKASLENIGSNQVKLIQFHPSYSYEDFVRGIVATTTNNGNGIKYETKNKVLVDMANNAYAELNDKGYYKTNDKEERKTILENSDKYILIIDEINRANLSSVLGELIYALEYRDEAVESMYALKGGSREITLPSNLYIIGTMNTADRSIGHIDYAIRRRFAFESVLPEIDIIKDTDAKKKYEEVEGFFSDKYLSPEFEKDRVMLGHSYFIAEDKKELEEKLKYQVIPLLEEYVSDGILIDSEKLRKEIKKLNESNS